MVSKVRTIDQVKADMAKLQAELVALGDRDAKRKKALEEIEEKLATVNRLLEECATIARDNDVTFSWETPMGGTMEYEGYWPDVEWNSSNCY